MRLCSTYGMGTRKLLFVLAKQATGVAFWPATATWGLTKFGCRTTRQLTCVGANTLAGIWSAAQVRCVFLSH